MIGQTVSHYKILEKLGEGGMGVVYRARDTTLDREVALKVLSPEVATESDRLERFQREAKALAALDHPDIVTVHSVEEADGVRFLTMQLVKGRPLSELIPKGGMPLERIFQVAIPLADALAAAHEKGVVHRDLKPGNIMVTDDGRLKILDFGLAKLRAEAADGGMTDLATEKMTREGRILGTVPYMSPEQAQGRPVDSRSDIFSLGVVLYELTTGERPFQGDTSADVVSGILRDTPSRVDTVRSGLPHHLGRVIDLCLVKDRERRYQSAKDIRNELEALAEELESERVLESAVTLTPAPLPRRGMRSLSIVAGAALLAGVAVLLGLNVDRLRGRTEPADTPPQARSLAVLPFTNLMNDPEQDYFVEGMHEALITNLSKIGALRVISRNSAIRYKGSEKSLPEIARELDVDALVEGSVLRADGEVRITARLIHGATDEHLWADSYDRDLANVLALLSEVAQSIAGEIEVTLTPREKARLVAVQQVDPAAQEAYLRGRAYFAQFTGAGFRKSLELSEKAIEIQPDYALAYAGVASAHLLLGGFGHDPLEESAPQARAAAMQALELDDELDDAHATLGWVRLYFDRDWEGAARDFERALEINPNHLYANHGYGDYLVAMGQPEDGLEYVKRGRRSDPAWPIANTPVAGHLVLARRYDEAIEECRALLELDPEYPGVQGWLGAAFWYQGEHELALAAYRKTWEGDPELREALDRGLAESGSQGALRAVAQELASRSQPGDPLGIANLFAQAGEVDAALDWLEKAYERRIPQLLLLPSHPAFDSLRSDPRFGDLLGRLGLTGSRSLG